MMAALSSSDYTGRVDGVTSSKPRRVQTQLQNICAMLSGLAVSFCNEWRAFPFADIAAREGAKEDVLERKYTEMRKFYSRMFEFARRHKIMNPGT